MIRPPWTRLLARVLASQLGALGAVALVLCLASAACSTMPPFTVEQYQADAGSSDATVPFDAGRLDSGSLGGGTFGGGTLGGGRDAGGLPGGGFDAGPFDAGRPDAGGGAVDFDYECTLYGISRSCRSAMELPRNCSGAPLGDVCFNLPGFGYAQMYQCQQNGAGRPSWTPTYRARCAYNCPVELPTTSFFNLSSDDCLTRPAIPCESGASGTTQDAVDGVLSGILRMCGLGSLSTNWAAGVTLGDEGCPLWFSASLPRVPQMQLQCLSTALEKLRFDCTPECSVISNITLF